jgi:hypothetical protein
MTRRKALTPIWSVATRPAPSAFPDEIDLCPRNWAERADPKLIYYNKHGKGGHFAGFAAASFRRPAHGFQIIAAGPGKVCSMTDRGED